MGLFRILRGWVALYKLGKALERQQALANDLAALPTREFVAACVRYLNSAGRGWHGSARPANPEAASLARTLRLPDDLADFYDVCNGFEAERGAMPAAILPIERLQVGGTFTPTLTDRLTAYWGANHGNDGERPEALAVYAPDTIAEFAQPPERVVSPLILNDAIALVDPLDSDVVVVVCADRRTELPHGTVLALKGGTATRYPSFTRWLASTVALQTSLGRTFSTPEQGRGMTGDAHR